jgi:Type IV secretion system pilin
MAKVTYFAKWLVVALAFLFLPIMAFAQDGTGTGPGPAQQVNDNQAPPQASGLSSVQGVLNSLCTVFDWLFYFLIALAVVFIVIAAYKYLTSSGDPEKVKGANNTIIYAAIAVAVALLAQAIPLVVSSFLGANNNGGNGIATCGSGSGYNPDGAE